MQTVQEVTTQCKVLAIDPGVTTGYAILDLQGNILDSGNVLIDDLSDSIFSTLEEGKGLRVVMEELPRGIDSRLRRMLEEVVRFLDTRFPMATKFSPGMWKSSPEARHPLKWAEGLEAIDKPSDHEKDAYHIGLYYLARSGGRI